MVIDISGIDLQSIVFEQILKVHPTGNFQADFLNLIFFPHLVIVLWLFLIAKSNLFLRLHRGLGFLLSAGIYIFIIYYGWYAMIASFSVFWLSVTILISLFYFMLPIFVHPSVTRRRFNIGKSIGSSLAEKRALQKAIDALGEEIRLIKENIRYNEDILKSDSSSESEKAKALESINQMKIRLLETEKEKRRLEQQK